MKIMKECTTMKMRELPEIGYSIFHKLEKCLEWRVQRLTVQAVKFNWLILTVPCFSHSTFQGDHHIYYFRLLTDGQRLTEARTQWHTTSEQ